MIVIKGKYQSWPSVAIRDNKTELKHVQTIIKGCRDEWEMRIALHGAGICFSPLPRYDAPVIVGPTWDLIAERGEANVQLIGRKDKV